VSVHGIVFSGKVPLNCTSAIVFIARICQQPVYDCTKSEYLLHFSHTMHRTELLFIVVFFWFFCSIVGKMLYATRVKSDIALDVLSHSPAALGTIFTSRAIIIHFLHLLHK
jgi:hypothetical protein